MTVAKTPPVVDFLYYPVQNYPGNPWCFRAVGTVHGDKYYSALCDHLAPAGTAYLFEYDATKKTFRLLVNTAKFLKNNRHIPQGMKYTPGEVQTQITFGRDGWLYYGTTRGSTRVTNDANGYLGDWVLRTHPESGKTELVSAYPIAKHCILAGVLDPQRMMFYGGTADGDYRKKNVMFFAVDVKTGKVIKRAANGFDRYAIFAKSTGRVYWKATSTTQTPTRSQPARLPMFARRRWKPHEALSMARHIARPIFGGSTCVARRCRKSVPARWPRKVTFLQCMSTQLVATCTTCPEHTEEQRKTARPLCNTT